MRPQEKTLPARDMDKLSGTVLGGHIGVYKPCHDLKRTLVAMSERTGMIVSQVTDEVLYTGLIEMQELPELED